MDIPLSPADSTALISPQLFVLSSPVKLCKMMHSVLLIQRETDDPVTFASLHACSQGFKCWVQWLKDITKIVGYTFPSETDSQTFLLLPQDSDAPFIKELYVKTYQDCHTYVKFICINQFKKSQIKWAGQFLVSISPKSLVMMIIHEFIPKGFCESLLLHIVVNGDTANMEPIMVKMEIMPILKICQLSVTETL